MSHNYKFADPEGLYFVSFATVHWIDVFVRRLYFDCLVENLNFCVDEKGMEIFAWCIMPSHMHLVFRSLKEKPEDLIGAFKSVTSRKLIKLIKENPQESRREWLLNAFKKAGEANSNNSKNQFWQQHNHPIELWSLPAVRSFQLRTNMPGDYISCGVAIHGRISPLPQANASAAATNLSVFHAGNYYSFE